MKDWLQLCCALVLSVTAQFNLNEIYPRQRCLYYFVLNDIVDYDVYSLPTHQIIPYCLLLSDADSLGSVSFGTETTFRSHLTFAQLKRRQISTDHLIAWSAPIDVAERYQIFLDDPHESSAALIFPNCTQGWFGPRCQYTLYENALTFAELVREVFISKLHDSERDHFTNGTCYMHLPCDRGPNPSCLDWREICDGKRDCVDGADEPQECLEREANECAAGDYRCHNGQCIPDEFYRDGDALNPDCSDWTDIKIYLPHGWCAGDPAFRCEEHVCLKDDEHPCGDGKCASIRHLLVDGCKHNRFYHGHRNLLADHTNAHLSPRCTFIMTCLTTAYDFIADDYQCRSICRTTSKCIELLTAHCPSEPFAFPRHPVAFGHVHLVYTINATLLTGKHHLLLPFLICYDEQLCAPIGKASVHYHNHTCRYYSEFSTDLLGFNSWGALISRSHALFRKCAPMVASNCTALFRCPHSSKCISQHRLLDGMYDCLDHSDEEVNDTCALNDPYRFQCSSKPSDCLSPLLVGDDHSHCPNGEDERQLAETRGYKLLPPFPLLCDSRVEMDPIVVDGREQTDETDCGPHFPCHNTYTHCDGFWHCANGIDEANCSFSLCEPLYHPCVSLLNMSIVCLPIELAGDGIAHCRGGSDERHFCRQMFPDDYARRYRCSNQTLSCIQTETLCDRLSVPDLTDDERCDEEENSICPEVYYEEEDFHGICRYKWDTERSTAEKILCDLDESGYIVNYNYTDSSLYLRLTRAGNFPSSLQDSLQPAASIADQERPLRRKNSLLYLIDRTWFCNRGMVIFVDGLEQRRCLCPPTYYGDRCEFQNERVSLTVRITALAASHWRTAFYLLFMLIDDDRVVQSYDYLIYVPVRDCDLKFHLYLTYASRPKSSTKRYRVAIHAYNKRDLADYTSWDLPISFSFLPVEHLVARLIIREQKVHSPAHCRLLCGRYGQCMKYENTDVEFCRCAGGWWGVRCDRNYSCDCSPDGKCIGSIGNQSICLCPLHRFGSRCYLTSSLCQLDTCEHGGTCVPADDRLPTKTVTCLCTEGFAGKRCEFPSTKIDISFEDVTTPHSFFAHFITVMDDEFHVRTSSFQKLLYNQNTATLYRSIAFHILFVEFSKAYYLTVLQEKYRPSAIITTQVLASHRCASVDTLLNDTIMSYNRLRRIKYYHLPCQLNMALSCFYDEEYMCLCNLDHHANCFDFDHNMTYNCQGANYCDNDGKCFQDHPTCPTASVCACDECYYGSRCQLTTKGYDLSLDAILGYHIHSHLTFVRQPWPVKISLIITIVMFVAGMVSASLSTIVFRPKNFKVGCDVYLFAAAIISLLLTIVFALQLLLLILSQMAFIRDRSVLWLNCISVNFLVKCLPNMVDWVYACVAIERACTAWKGVNFKRRTSRYVAKRMACLLCIFVIGTAVHDPIHRRLIEDHEERRVWCIIEYSSSLKLFNRVMNVCHLLIPFLSNATSSLLIIVTMTRRRSTVRKNQTFREHLALEFHQHKHLLISSCILVVLAFPRLLMSFTFRCMKSARDPGWFLLLYYIPFIPSISIIFIYVLPSNTYTKMLRESLRKTRTSLCA